MCRQFAACFPLILSLVLSPPTPLLAQAARTPATADPADAPVAASILAAPFAPTVDELMAHVRHLASDELRGRRAGSPEAKLAAEHIAAAFAAAGFEPAGDEGSFRQVFALPRLHGTLGKDGKVVWQQHDEEGANVCGVLVGSDPDAGHILVGAHYDHLGVRGDHVYFGADDNASGVAGLCGIARAFAAEGAPRPRHSIVLVAFDGEEEGLRGAEHYARHPVRPLSAMFTMVNLDMIGRGQLLDQKKMALPKRLMKVPDGPALGVLGTRQAPVLDRVMRQVFAHEQLPVFAPEDFGMLGKVIEKQAEGRSDHAPFERRGIPFLFFSNSEHDDYHQPTDTVDTLDAEALHRATRAIWRTILAIDALPQKPEFVTDPDAAAEGDAGEGAGDAAAKEKD